MKHVLFLPMMQMSSGHQRAADTLMHSLQKRDPAMNCRKVEFLSYVHQGLEKVITNTYLRWIEFAPAAYETVYRWFAHPGEIGKGSILLKKRFDRIFQGKMRRLIEEEAPDLIICTHAFPSFLLARLKERDEIQVPVINVYTDYFVNRLWGRQTVEFHFVTDFSMKQHLIQDGVEGKQIFVTGIPVDESYYIKCENVNTSPPYRILFTGGNGGHGDILTLLNELRKEKQIHVRCTILCGKNNRLFEEIQKMEHPDFLPLPYVNTRERIGRLYDEADAVVTKPGGITISEALVKRVPIFIHSSLPGQETMNELFLAKEKLGYVLSRKEPFAGQIVNLLGQTKERKQWESRLEDFHRKIDCNAFEKVFSLVYQT